MTKSAYVTKNEAQYIMKVFKMRPEQYMLIYHMLL